MPEGHVVLVGLMGSGKTTVGRRLAKLLDRPFVDADEALEGRTGRTIADLFSTEGEQTVRAIEAEVLATTLAAPIPTVVASGGGVVVTAANRTLLRDPGTTVIWLRADPAFLAGRTKAKASRPLLTGEPGEVFARLHAERAEHYRDVADLVVDVEPFHLSDKPKRALAEHVADLVRAREAGRVPA